MQDERINVGCVCICCWNSVNFINLFIYIFKRFVILNKSLNEYNLKLIIISYMLKKTMKFKLYIVNFIVFLYVNFYFCSAFILFMKNIDNIENIIMNKSKIAHIPIT